MAEAGTGTGNEAGGQLGGGAKSNHVRFSISTLSIPILLTPQIPKT